MEKEYPSEVYRDIINEIAKKEDTSKIDEEKLMKRAEKIQQERKKKRIAEQKAEEEKNRAMLPTAKQVQERKKESIEENIKELKEVRQTEWTREEILKEFNTYPPMRMIYFNVAVNQPTMNLMMRRALGFEADFGKQIQRQLWKLRRMGLVQEMLVCEPYWKNYFNEKYKTKLELTKEEKAVLKKLDIRKNTDERKRNVLIGNSGFWSLTELGKEMLPIIKNGCAL